MSKAMTPEGVAASRRRWDEASARRLKRLVAMPIERRARLSLAEMDRLTAKMTYRDRAEFYRRLTVDSRAVGFKEGMKVGEKTARAVVIDRWLSKAADRWHALRGRLAERSRAAALTSQTVPAWTMRATERAMGAAERALGAAWSPLKWLAAKFDWLWPVVLSVAFSAALEVWMVTPSFADPARWPSMAANLGPALAWMLYQGAWGASGADVRKPLRLCAWLQVAAAAWPMFVELDRLSRVAADLSPATANATIFVKAWFYAESWLAALVTQGNPYAWALGVAAVALLLHARLCAKG